MILSSQNYDAYREFDINRKLKEEEKQMKMMKQDIMKKQLAE